MSEGAVRGEDEQAGDGFKARIKRVCF